MMYTVPDVLDRAQLERFRSALAGAAWVDGRGTAGHLAVQAKQNLQLADTDPLAVQLGDTVMAALGRNPAFIAAALPLKLFPPRFNRYTGGGTYGEHVDSAILSIAGTPHRVRTDLSATLFLSEPDEYDGGELVVQDSYGEHRVKLPAGHLGLYPGTSLHRVTPVTRGARTAAFFWVQSLVRDDARRALLHDLDLSIRTLTRDAPGHAELARLTGIYHNLLRHWSDT